MAQTNYGVSITQTVGSHLKRELKGRGVTREEFSYNFGIDSRTVWRWISDGIHLCVFVVVTLFYTVWGSWRGKGIPRLAEMLFSVSL